jgi:UPF0716 family protein affecting phage T7 exclusion
MAVTVAAVVAGTVAVVVAAAVAGTAAADATGTAEVAETTDKACAGNFGMCNRGLCVIQGAPRLHNPGTRRTIPPMASSEPTYGCTETLVDGDS